jgi:O-antigen ligase
MVLWDSIGVLLEKYLNAYTLVGGVLALAFILFVTLWAKDIRAAMFIFLVVILFTGAENAMIHTVCYVLRWIILALIVLRIFKKNVQQKLPLVSMLCLIIILFAYLSAFQAPSLFRGLVFATVYLLCFFVFFVIFYGEVRTEQDVEKWYQLFAYMGIFFILLALFSYVLNPSVYSRGMGGRFTGFFANSAEMARSIIFGASILIWSGLRMKEHYFKQFIFYGVAAIGLIFLLLAGSRGALGGMAIILAILSFRFKRKMTLFILPALIIGGIYLVPKVLMSASEQYTQHLTSLEEASRPMLRELGVQRFLERPIRGWGLGSLSDINADVCPDFVSLHNLYLNYLVEFGLPGFLVIMTLFLVTYLRTIKLAINGRTEVVKEMALFNMAWLTTLFLWGYVDTSVNDPSKIYFYWMLILIVISQVLVEINAMYGYNMLYPCSEDQQDGYISGDLNEIEQC